MTVHKDSPIGLQTDTLSPVPTPVRTITATVMVNVNGTLTPTDVAMQVIALADGSGNIIDDFADYAWKTAMLTELRQMKSLLAQSLGVFLPVPEDDVSQSPIR